LLTRSIVLSGPLILLFTQSPQWYKDKRRCETLLHFALLHSNDLTFSVTLNC